MVELIASLEHRASVPALVKRGDVYYARYRDKDGRRHVVSLGTSSPGEARRKLAELAVTPHPRRAPAAATAAQSEREAWEKERRALLRQIEEMRYRGAARAQLESAPYETIADVLNYVADRTARSDVAPLDVLGERTSVWRAAAVAAAAEARRIDEQIQVVAG